MGSSSPMVFMVARVFRLAWTWAHFSGSFFVMMGALRVGVVLDEIVFEFGGDDVARVLGDHGEEFGVGLVGERVAAGFDDEASIEIAVGDVVIDGIEVGEDEAHGFDGVIDALDVEVFGLLVGAFDGEEFEGADLGQDEDEAGVEVAAEAGSFAVGLPVVVGGGLKRSLGGCRDRGWECPRESSFYGGWFRRGRCWG